MAETTFFTRWRLLQDATVRLGRARCLNEALEILREQTRAIAQSDGVTIVRRDGDHVAYVGEDALTPLWTGQRFPIGNCISGHAIVERRPILIPDITLDDRVPLAAYLPTFVKSMAMFPLGPGEPSAALGIYWAHAGPIDLGAMRLLELLAQAMTSVMRGFTAADLQRAPVPIGPQHARTAATSGR